MLVAHEFFDALPFHLIEVRCPFMTTLQNAGLTFSNLLENPSGLERGADHLYSRPSRQTCPEAFGRPDFTLALNFALP
jgi:hypothetical protein